MPGKLTVERWGSGWAVFEDGRRRTGVNMMAQAELMRDRMERAQTARRRKCLCCGAEFLSEGPGHRLCARHRAIVGGYDRQMAG